MGFSLSVPVRTGELGGVRNFFFVHDADFTEVKQFVRDCDARWVKSWRILDQTKRRYFWALCRSGTSMSGYCTTTCHDLVACLRRLVPVQVRLTASFGVLAHRSNSKAFNRSGRASKQRFKNWTCLSSMTGSPGLLETCIASVMPQITCL